MDLNNCSLENILFKTNIVKNKNGLEQMCLRRFVLWTNVTQNIHQLVQMPLKTYITWYKCHSDQMLL
jgi:hypothetical protein